MARFSPRKYLNCELGIMLDQFKHLFYFGFHPASDICTGGFSYPLTDLIECAWGNSFDLFCACRKVLPYRGFQPREKNPFRAEGARKVHEQVLSREDCAAANLIEDHISKNHRDNL